jgi:hypothetical protein
LLRALKGIYTHGLQNIVPMFFRASHVYARKLPRQLMHQLKTAADKARLSKRWAEAKAASFIQIPQFDFFRKK